MKTRPFLSLTLLTVTALAVPSMAAANDTVEIPVKLPKVYFAGTPSDYLGPNLDLTLSTANPGPILAPAGTGNVALNKPVTASTNTNFGKLSFITDGEISHEEKVLLELGPGLQWVQIDLEKPHDIYGIMVWHSYAEERVYFDMIVQVSTDPEFKKDVTTVFNADHDNSSGLGAGKNKEYKESYRGHIIPLPDGAKGRYVRLYSNGNDADQMSRYVEVEVFGVTAE